MNQEYRKMTPQKEPLCAVFPSLFVKNQSLEVKKLAGDASKREYFRIEQNKKFFILQTDDPFPGVSPNKHPFLAAQAIFKKIALPVPEIHSTWPESGWVLMEDLGDLFLQKQPEEKHYKRALDHLVLLADKAHQNFFKEAHDELSLAPHWNWAFDEKKLCDEMLYTQNFLVEEYCHKDGKDFLNLVLNICQELAARPRVFCHRDYHSRNLMITSQELFIIDFQDARMGPLSYDVASLLWDPYVKMDDAFRSRLLNYWKAALPSRLKSSDLDREIHLMKIQRLLKAAGSYASFVSKKNTKEYLPYLQPALVEAKKSCEELNLNKLSEFISEIMEIHQEKERII